MEAERQRRLVLLQGTLGCASNEGGYGRRNSLRLLLQRMFGKPENWHACAEHLSPRWKVMAPALPIFELPLDMEQPDEFNLLVELFLDRLFSEAAVSNAVAPLW